MTHDHDGTVHCVSTLLEAQNIEAALQKRKTKVFITRCGIWVKLFVLNLFLSLVRRLWFSPFSSNISEQPSIVIYMHGTLGDHVVHLPALRSIRESFLRST